MTRLLLQFVDVANENKIKIPRSFALLIKQALYFDRYQRLLAPTLDPLRDARVNIPKSMEEVERVGYGGRGRRGEEDDDGMGVVIDVTPKK